MEMYAREKEFGIFLSEKFSSTKRGTSGIFYKDFGDKIKAAIKDPSSVDKNLRYFVKQRGFQILSILSLGARNVLVVPAKQQVGLTVMLVVGDCRCAYSHAFHRTIHVRRAAYVEEFYEIIRVVHEKDLLHAGMKKTFEKVWCHVVHVSVTVYVLLVLSCRVCIMVFQEVW